MPRFEVRYADVMRHLEMGYAIWQADPFDEYEKITLGCAGEINKGKLTPRWQMWQDASYLEGQIHRQRIEARKPLHTTNVKEVNVDISLSSDTLPAPASAGFGIGYQCTDSRAGLLSLKDGYAISEDLRKRREKELTKYLISHHEEIMSACEIEDLEELAVVTGTTMTGDWDAVYLESNSREGRVSVEAGLSQVLLQRTNVVVKHSRNQNPFLSSGHHHNPPRDPGCSCCEEIKNQCIFVRTLRLRRRPLRKTPKVIKAGAEPNDYDRDSDTGYDADGILSDSTNSIGSSSDEEHLLVVKDEDDDIIQAPDLVDQAFDYIFSNCNAELAILHDRDIEKMREALNGNSSPMLPIAVNDEFSVASLFHEDNPVINSGWDIVHSTTPKTHPDDESGEPPRGLRHGTQRYPIFKEPRVEERSDHIRPPCTPILQAPGALHDPGNQYLPGARETMLAELQSWILDRGSYKILWPSGIAAVGKSTITTLLEQRWPLTRTKRPSPEREVEKSSSTKLFAKPRLWAGKSYAGWKRDRTPTAMYGSIYAVCPDDNWRTNPNPTPLLDPDLLSKLSNKQVAMIAIGSVIGTGLFLGPPTLLSRGGPLGMVAAYMILGALIFSMMSCLSEMLSFRHAPGHAIPVKPAIVVASVATFVACDFYLFNYSKSDHNQLFPRNALAHLWDLCDPVWIVALCIFTAFHPVCGIHRIHRSMESFMPLLKILMLAGLSVLGIGVERGKWHGPERIAFRYWKNPVNTFLAKDTASPFILTERFFNSYLFIGVPTGLFAVALVMVIRFSAQSRHKPKSNSLDLYLLLYLISYLLQAPGRMTSDRPIYGRQMSNTGFSIAQGSIQQLGEAISATITFAVAVDRLFNIAFHFKFRYNWVRNLAGLSLCGLYLSLYTGIVTGFGGVYEGLYSDSDAPLISWYGIRGTFATLEGEYLWLWIGAASSIILLSLLFTLTRFCFCRQAANRKIRHHKYKAGTIDLIFKGAFYPAAYALLILPISFAHWISFRRDATSLPAIGPVEQPLWFWDFFCPVLQFAGSSTLLSLYCTNNGDGVGSTETDVRSHDKTLHDSRGDSDTMDRETNRALVFTRS